MIKMGRPSEKSSGERAKKWVFAFVKFNIVGFAVFLVATGVYAAAFNTFGAMTWLIASATGGILQFSLINYLNTTKRGKIFNSCEQQNKDSS
jgi:hypothetical protein